MPVLFLPHGGGPCFFMDWTWGDPDAWKGLGAWLSQLSGQIAPRPRAIVIVSGHWEEPRFTVNSGAHPPLLYDYHGFPEHTYHLTYPAPGDPALAARVRDLLAAAGLPAGLDGERGFDHGVFIPFKLIYPDAGIPIVQLSLRAGLDPAEHLAAGRALAGLRDEGVLLVGSGMSFHNLRAFGLAGGPPSAAFDGWLEETLAAADRDERLLAWRSAPGAALAHPREEHLAPLFFAAGAAGSAPPVTLFKQSILGVIISGFGFGSFGVRS